MAVELKVALIIYSGEFGQDKEELETEQTIRDKNVKKLYLEDVALYTDEFSFRETAKESMMASMLRRESAEEGGDRDSDVPLPLQLASLAGKQEVVLIFTETNEFGLPRAVREVEMNLGGVLVHAYPHQGGQFSGVARFTTVRMRKAKAVMFW